MISYWKRLPVVIYDLFKLTVLLALLIAGAYFGALSLGYTPPTISFAAQAVATTAPQNAVTPSTNANTTTNGDTSITPTTTVSTGANSSTATQPDTVVIPPPTFNLPQNQISAGEILLTGNGQPDSSVAVVIDGAMAGITTADSSGQWQLPVNLPNAGDYTLHLRAIDPNGIVVAESEPVTLRVGAAQAVAPILNVPSGDIQAGQVNLTGTGTPGETVEIIVNGEVIGTTTVGSDGRWSFTPDLPATGDYAIGLQVKDAAGNVISQTEPVLVRVNRPQPPLLNLPTGDIKAGQVALSGTGAPGSQLELLVNGQPAGAVTAGSDGNWNFVADLPEIGDYTIVLQMKDADGAVVAESEPVTLKVNLPRIARPTLDLPEGQVEAGLVVISGTGEPGREVEVLVNEELDGVAPVGSDGVWRYRVLLPETGDYQLVVQAKDETGAVVGVSEPVTVSVVEPTFEPVPTPAQPVPSPEGGQDYIVQAEDWLSKIADKFYGDPQAYPAIFDATNEKAAEDDTYEVIENANLIYIGQKIWVPDAATLEQQ